MSGIDQDLFSHLAGFDTPTICNALEEARGFRSTEGFTLKPLVCAFTDLKPIVGFARTATIRATRPSDRKGDEARQHRLAYYSYVCSEPHPTIAVIEDLDEHKGTGAFWGEVNTAIHKGLGVLGCVTDGSIRDLDMIAPGFQLLAGSVGPSHAFVHCVDFGLDVTVAGMKVRHGDIIHADRHGATVIPLDLLPKLPAAIDVCIRQERPILEAARSADFDIEMLKRAMAEADEIH
ncbi:MAG TPA: RraA family protein [Geminicoccus sp.]|jgi:regulator of RNase E activity RraA|uniref:RraA family protein n=1 Tax=Geminicoccus sp. TaxID=2024832 RepID=UPI002E35C6C2|nr:RraA family protein [Geminicoccus sp.]HEX2526847.1 RraA family protein [Geminicoccus sp.]